jgi:hypothetical protein
MSDNGHDLKWPPGETFGTFDPKPLVESIKATVGFGHIGGLVANDEAEKAKRAAQVAWPESVVRKRA